MGVNLGEVGEGEGFQVGYILALFQVILPHPALGRIGAVVPEHCDHLVGESTGHGEIDAGPDFPHHGALDVSHLLGRCRVD